MRKTKSRSISRVARAKPNSFLKGMKREVSLQPYMKRLRQSTLKVLPILLLIFLLFINVIQVHAATDYFVWDKDLAISLPAYTNYIEFTYTTYFSEFTWDDPNATSVTFTDLGTSTSSTLSTFTTALDAGNLTFFSISGTQIDFNLTAATSSNYTLPSKPTEVLLAHISNPEGGNWTWNSLTSTLTLTTTSPTLVGFTFTATPSKIAFVIAAFAAVIAIVATALTLESYTKRKPQ